MEPDDQSDDDGVEEDQSSSSSSSDDNISVMGVSSPKKKTSKRRKARIEKDTINPSTAEKLSEFFKDLDDNPDKPIVLVDNSTKFVLDGMEVD